MGRRIVLAAALSAILLAAAGPAYAGGGSYAFDGGTRAERGEVRAALDASAFDWSLVPAQIAIHVVRGIPVSYSTPGQIWLDADLLDSGRFSWGTVQMEYAQQVHFFLLTDQMRQRLTAAFGATDWCYETPTPDRGDNACERFAATLAWAYWPSPDNSVRPRGPDDWSAAMTPAAFRTLVASLVPEASVALSLS
jgi:hypothetical protein